MTTDLDARDVSDETAAKGSAQDSTEDSTAAAGTEVRLEKADPAATSGSDTSGASSTATESGSDTTGEKSDAATKKDPETSPRAEPASRTRRLRGAVTGRGLLISALAVLAVVSTVAAAILGWQVKTQHDIETAGRGAQDAAEQFAVILTSIDSKSLDGDFAAVMDGATGAFKDMYGQASTQLKQLLVDNNATGTGTVIDSAVKSATTERAEILLFVDQTVTNSASPEPRIDRSRVLMTMERVDGRWLAAQVTLP